MSVNPNELSEWRSWIGRQEARAQLFDAESLRRFAAAIGEDLDVERIQPSLGHWAFFVPVHGRNEMEADGHPARGGFLPPVSHPQRMFAASSIRFHAPLILNELAEQVSTVVDVVEKSGCSGSLVLVQIDRCIKQAGSNRVTETQTIVYRENSRSMALVRRAETQGNPGDTVWHPQEIDLFRFSAATFNSHRIHYDLPYAQHTEGYPALVVQGPFTAAKLCGLARQGGRNPRTFGFRARAPLFCGQAVTLRSDATGSARAIRCDGTEAMVASVEY